MSDTNITLTSSAFDELKKELEFLETEKRQEITKRIALARDEGDLKENGGYHAARDEQGKNEAKIRELAAKLEKAKIVDITNFDTVQPGTVVKIELNGREREFLIASRDMADKVDYDVYSEDSPIGSAVLGKKVGETTNFVAPNGNEQDIKILEIKKA
ncbi:MAG: transcription elongation factor GreA [Bifidobacteriaceae bacterium]|jgi:transcription elongation factor GreA|nr:transcription elongation factor GreA [Bifidobacteriaceae bacterium]